MQEPFKGVTKLIGVAPVKNHQRAGASMTLKNWYGLLGGRRNQFHQDIDGIITELAGLVRPTFVILDGTQSMMTNGPTGGSLADLKDTHTLVVSTDPVAADAFGCTLLGKTVRDLPYLIRAGELGLGSVDYESSGRSAPRQGPPEPMRIATARRIAQGVPLRTVCLAVRGVGGRHRLVAVARVADPLVPAARPPGGPRHRPHDPFPLSGARLGSRYRLPHPSLWPGVLRLDLPFRGAPPVHRVARARWASAPGSA